MQTTLNRKLKSNLQERRALIVPGVANALAARLTEDLGFEALYLTGAGISNTFLGMPDLGFIGLTDLVQHTAAIRRVVDLPLIVDADTGFGSALNVHYTVRALEQAGANGVQLEDQIMPKKCGHFADKAVVSRAEAVARVRAAVEARSDPDFQIIARTDARAAVGLDEALLRAELFAREGADVVFVEAPESREEIEKVVGHVDMPHVLNLVIGGKTPTISHEDAKKMRIGMVLYANVALQSAVAGMRTALEHLKSEGQVDETTPGIASFSDRQKVVRKDYFDDLDRRYTVAE
ncbi:isocitrate lyase/PEP mutase family protein [Propylenella binzhouense]|uniref:Oxaloacetate decarboxylase n=1 Tax=Propylenella binzhouense TaxID=2555902 RepID=A0A964WS37_9HYPH|nr:oxaloacetate decarboxylase [Propylenella binzhouense]MYZ46563.1 oxaloacetate decarboxylase [Propylenella binzhouense]